MFTGLGEYFCLCEKVVFVAPEKAACTSSCTVGNVDTRLWRVVHYVVLHSINTVELIIDNFNNKWLKPGKSRLFTLLTLLLFKNMAPTVPTMQFYHWVTSLQAVYQIAHSFLWSHRRLHTTFFTYAVVLPKTCKFCCRLEVFNFECNQRLLFGRNSCFLVYNRILIMYVHLVQTCKYFQRKLMYFYNLAEVQKDREHEQKSQLSDSLSYLNHLFGCQNKSVLQ